MATIPEAAEIIGILNKAVREINASVTAGTPVFTANGTVATVMSSRGPTDATTDIRKWLTIADDVGGLFYLPMWGQVAPQIILSGVIDMSTFNLTTGQVQAAQVTFYSGLNATGNVIIPTAQSLWASTDPSITVASTGLETANVTAVSANGAGTDITATDPTSGVVATATVVVADAVIITPTPAAADHIMASFASVSSLSTGRLGYLVGWGGNEFGYAYTYALDGTQPAGLTIDADMGILSAASPIAAGSYTFGVIVTNRENPTNANTLPFTLNVLTGVTSGRTGTQILHKTYDPHSGTYGTPTGNNWTAVLNAIKAAILADQAANLAADGVETQLRATIPFHKGVTYQYTDNHWLNGVQYYDVTATGSGVRPVLQNNGSGTSYEGGPLNIGNSGSMNRGGFRKSLSALIDTVVAGSTTVVCTTHAQVSRLIPGRWHCVVGSAIQLAGEPPNLMFLDWVKVLSVNAGTGVVTLDRPLKYAYDSTWWENAADDISFGRGWIYPADTDSNGRATLRGRFYGINFQPNPNGSDIMLLQSHIQSDFDDCITQNLQLTLGKHYALFNCTMQHTAEPDKQSETLFLDGTTTDGIGGATGFSYFLFRNSTVNGGIQISPRQFRSIGSTFNAGSSTTPPYTFSFNGPNLYVNLKSTIFTGSVGNSWTYTANPFAPLTIGTNATWSGNQLRIPTSFANFEHWLINSYVGGIVAVNGLGPITANWGYIDQVTSDGAGGALWLNITWVNGTRPTSGTIDIVGSRMRRLFMEPSCSFTGAMTYADAKFAEQTVTPFGSSWSFPTGIPDEFTNHTSTTRAVFSQVSLSPIPLPALTGGVHPRIMMDATRVARLVARWTDPAFASWIAPHKIAMDPFSIALRYLATGSTTGLSGAVTTAIGVVLNPASPFNPSYPYAYTAFDAIYLFDWCYAALTGAQRTSLIAYIETIASQLEAILPTKFSLHEGMYTGDHGYIMACLACLGEPGFADRRARLRNIVQNYCDWQTEAYEAGAWDDYSYQGSYFAAIPIMWALATGQNASTLSPWMANRAEYILRCLASNRYQQLAQRGDNSPTADGWIEPSSGANANELYMIADYTRSTLAQWVGDGLLAGLGVVNSSAGWLWQGLIFYDNTLVGQSPTALSTPTSYSEATFSPQLGFNEMRGGWNLAADVRAWFYGGPNRDHDHPSGGHMVIYRGDQDLITSGTTYVGTFSPYYDGWCFLSLGKSCLHLAPNASATPDASGSQRIPGGAQVPASSLAFPVCAAVSFTGVSSITLNSVVSGTPTDDGTTVKTVLDMAQAWATNQGSGHLRTLWYVRGATGVGTYIVWDRWIAPSPALSRVRQIWWSKTKPVGGAQTVVTGSTSAGVITLAAAPIVITRGSSQLTIQSLTTPTVRRLVGGVGYEQWKDGANVPLPTWFAGIGVTQAVFDARVARVTGQWRTELEHANAATEIITALTVGASPSTAPVLSITAGSPRTIAVGAVTIQLN